MKEGVLLCDFEHWSGALEEVISAFDIEHERPVVKDILVKLKEKIDNRIISLERSRNDPHPT